MCDGRQLGATDIVSSESFGQLKLVNSLFDSECQPSDAELDPSVSATCLAILTTTTASMLKSGPTSPDAPTMRILFHPLQSTQSTQSTQEVVYEHLELTSFGSPHIQSTCPPHELAIKAVYKATAVGIRYFSAEGKLHTFNRFQINFESHEDVLRFIDATKAWIPAKLSNDSQPSPLTARMTTRRSRTSQPNIIPTPFPPASPIAAGRLGEVKVHQCTGSSRSGVGGNSWPQPTPTSDQASWNDAQHSARNAHQFARPGDGEQSGINPIPSISSSPHLDSHVMDRLDRILPQLRGALRAPEEELSARGPDSCNGVRAESDVHHELASVTELAQLDDASLLDLIHNVLYEHDFELLVERVNGVLQRSDGWS
ncbi:BQ2448_7565 [Microbotryum intermedium]|uniref:BQ2448_7565 protein n=1 Tax=Microbotryum intermedium TaxID=269621 RepID=A0A238FTY3_9BASI|nr:BQ2448_7565 [Microbotryum intermedium]